MDVQDHSIGFRGRWIEEAAGDRAVRLAGGDGDVFAFGEDRGFWNGGFTVHTHLAEFGGADLGIGC